MPKSAKIATLPATCPGNSATVSASAGTGKTWLLVTRLIRLLLTDARPDGILAVTFTRKAAAEMQTRLNARLHDMAQCSEPELIKKLAEMGMSADETSLPKARGLYETLLRNPKSIRTTTFHSFCQEILRRFPLEADIAPGFELLETSADERKIAWNALCADASNDPNGEIAQAMETLLNTCGGLVNTTTALDSFLDHRSDWWAFTEEASKKQTDEHPDPLQFAIDTLSFQLNVSLDENPEQDFFTPSILDMLSEFISLLRKHPGKKNEESIVALTIAIESSIVLSDRFIALKKAFLTQKGEPLKRKESKAQAKSMGESGQQQFLKIHDLICSAIDETQKIIYAQESLRRNIAWYQAGIPLLNHFQRLKTERRLLDFSDLEWRAYLLLNHGDNVHWIQYKLDQRIDHLLIDEFQDTNPTQWRLILPLLQELAAGKDERGRSIFLVGDNKQSIYRFRRADPELFITAQSWLKNNLHAISQPLDISWRSADAIIRFVNCIFGEGPLHQRLSQYSTHSTHHSDLWGRVEFLPLVEQVHNTEYGSENEAIKNISGSCFGLRNPLQTPRTINEDQRHLGEGRLIAARILSLMSNETLVGHTSSARALRYSDIVILLRTRTHAAEYEQALREAGIPYIGANRGTLLNSQEARDLINLLELLIAPFNNLALANLLRSPIFDCSHGDLMRLASEKGGNWMQRLTSLASLATAQHTLSKPLIRAHTLLNQWKDLAGKLPVHDLLDRIYCDGDVMNRYHCAYPSHLRHRVAANLTRFIELALEVDSGRHPTIGRFVARLKLAQEQEQDAPDEGIPIQNNSQVRIMTIHASKGLESPVIFLADSTTSTNDKKANHAIVDWPPQSERPRCFLLQGKKEKLDKFTAKILEQHEHAEAREDANLLYVAITRARQLLFISGCQPARGSDLGWYGLMADQCRENNIDDVIIFESGNYPEAGMDIPKARISPIAIDHRLGKPLPGLEQEIIIAPSHRTGRLNQKKKEYNEGISIALQEDTRTRGIFIHRCIQLLTEETRHDQHNSGSINDATILNRVTSELELGNLEKETEAWLEEAKSVIKHPKTYHLFQGNQYLTAFNELPIQYNQIIKGNERMVYGIIDRVIITEDTVIIVDYKTHRLNTPRQLAELGDYYRPQIELYCQGAKLLWPKKKISGFLLFTHNPQLVQVGQ